MTIVSGHFSTRPSRASDVIGALSTLDPVLLSADTNEMDGVHEITERRLVKIGAMRRRRQRADQ